MEFEEDLPRKADDPLAQLCKQDLDPLSLDELEARVEALQSEIVRVKAKIDGAQSHRKAADELFKR